MNNQQQEKMDRIIHLLENIEKLLVDMIAKEDLPRGNGFTNKHRKIVRFDVLGESMETGKPYN